MNKKAPSKSVSATTTVKSPSKSKVAVNKKPAESKPSTKLRVIHPAPKTGSFSRSVIKRAVKSVSVSKKKK